MQKILISKRRGVSLLNVMVFMVFAVILTAQVFFFAKNAVDEVADEREMMMYRMNLDSLVQEAKEALQKNGIGTIYHNPEISDSTKTYNFATFSRDMKAKIKKAGDNWQDWEKDSKWNGTPYDLRIYDLHYNYYSESFNSGKWQEQSGSYTYGKVFAAIPPDTELQTRTISSGDESVDVNVEVPIRRYYLIRAWVQLPENFYGSKLMYQVLVKRSDDVATPEPPKPRKLQTLSFQEVWF
ncbi:MAG: hypothetical protein IJQ74_05230 [Synergistaceae bacterium]|nr:hypothetical protein [Synergistaceae bacterium]